MYKNYNLVIVESPAKCVKIEKYLGNGYKCIASYGHLRELDSSFVNNVKSIDLKFKPKFTIIENKKKQILKLQKMISEASEVILASDDDREGESIAWHICDMFNLPINDVKRIVFHEITENAIKNAINNPRRVNMDVVYAQQSRQILDMIVGYKLSPILWKNISKNNRNVLSAGRCQTPTLRIVYENQKDIEKCEIKKVYTTTGYFTSKNLDFTLNKQYENEKEMSMFLEDSLNHKHIYKCDKVINVSKKPPLPFNTSRLQQVASIELKISPKDTMNACQKLYEEGYITYMRTESIKYSMEFLEKAYKYITKKYGKEYNNLNEKSDNNDENMCPHEAIRPTNIELEEVDKSIGNKEYRIYNLIRRNTLESCMQPATSKGVTAKISAPSYNEDEKNEYKYYTEQIIFPGWKVVNGYEKESKSFRYLQTLKQDSVLEYNKIISNVGLKNTKSHYNESNLVQLLEKNGIGRPSTFSSLVEKIQERDYVKRQDVKGNIIECIDFILEGDELIEKKINKEMGNEKNKLIIQPIGIIVLEFLLNNFEKLFKYEYTKNMEDDLDLIAKGEKKWYELCNDCLNEITLLSNDLKNKKEEKEENEENIKIDENHTYIVGKYGPVVKYVSNNKKRSNITFKSVNPNLDIIKIKNGEYTLDEILLNDVSNKELGIYNDNPIYLKNGKFGYYIEWRDIKKSASSETLLDDAIKLLSKNESSCLTIVRKIDDNTSIRTGKYGDYIFHKKKNWKNPKFFKLNDFISDNSEHKDISYRSCDISILSKWIYTKFNL